MCTYILIYQVRGFQEVEEVFRFFGGHSFQAAVPTLWNAQPPSLQDVTSVETFKKNLKTFLFRKAFAV